MDLLSDKLKSAFNDSAIAQNFKCKRTKATAIIKYVLGETIETIQEYCELDKLKILIEGKPDGSVNLSE